MIKIEKQNKAMINKVVASSLLVAAMWIGMGLSWVASPDPFFYVFARSTPWIVMILVLVLVTVCGANIISRILATIFFISFGVVYFVYFHFPEWGVSHIFIGLTVLVDMGITASGCKSPMVSNANDNFLVVAAIFFAGFFVGYLLELLNVVALGWWVLSPSFTYPMVSLSGINLLVMFTYAFIGFLLFELAFLTHILIQRAMRGKENMCKL